MFDLKPCLEPKKPCSATLLTKQKRPYSSRMIRWSSLLVFPLEIKHWRLEDSRKILFSAEESACFASMMPVIGAKPSGRSLSKARNAATFVISKPTSKPSYVMKNTRASCTTTLYLPNPISTAVPNLRSDRRKPYAYQALICSP